MSDTHCLCPAVVITRSSREPTATAAEWCDTFKMHRFAAIADSPTSATSMIEQAIADGGMPEDIQSEFAESNGLATLVMWPASGTPTDGKNLYLHNGFFLDPDDPDSPVVCYRTLVAASSPEMADWIARDAAGAIWKKESFHDSVIATAYDSGTEDAIAAKDGAVVYLGRVNRDEARAMFRSCYSVVRKVAKAAVAEAKELLAKKVTKFDNQTLRRLLDPAVGILLDDDSPRDDIIESLVLQHCEDMTARQMTSEGAENYLSNFMEVIAGRFWRPYDGQFAAHAVGAGIALMRRGGIEAMREAAKEGPRTVRLTPDGWADD